MNRLQKKSTAMSAKFLKYFSIMGFCIASAFAITACGGGGGSSSSSGGITSSLNKLTKILKDDLVGPLKDTVVISAEALTNLATNETPPLTALSGFTPLAEVTDTSSYPYKLIKNKDLVSAAYGDEDPEDPLDLTKEQDFNYSYCTKSLADSENLSDEELRISALYDTTLHNIGLGVHRYRPSNNVGMTNDSTVDLAVSNELQYQIMFHAICKALVDLDKFNANNEEGKDSPDGNKYVNTTDEEEKAKGLVLWNNTDSNLRVKSVVNTKSDTSTSIRKRVDIRTDSDSKTLQATAVYQNPTIDIDGESISFDKKLNDKNFFFSLSLYETQKNDVYKQIINGISINSEHTVNPRLEPDVFATTEYRFYINYSITATTAKTSLTMRVACLFPEGTEITETITDPQEGLFSIFYDSSCENKFLGSKTLIMDFFSEEGTEKSTDRLIKRHIMGASDKDASGDYQVSRVLFGNSKFSCIELGDDAIMPKDVCPDMFEIGPPEPENGLFFNKAAITNLIPYTVSTSSADTFFDIENLAFDHLRLDAE